MNKIIQKQQIKKENEWKEEKKKKLLKNLHAKKLIDTHEQKQ